MATLLFVIGAIEYTHEEVPQRGRSMDVSGWFEHPVLMDLPPAEAAAKLREVGEDAAAAALEAGPVASPPDTFGPLRWVLDKVRTQPHHSSHAFGYIGADKSGKEAIPIVHLGLVKPNPRLKDARLKVTLDGVGCPEYPGAGPRRILCHFYTQNRLGDSVEEAHYQAAYRVGAGERAAVLNYPIFHGVHIGPDGLTIRCRTVNVCNDDDETVLAAMESETFRAGLQLAAAAQPALVPFGVLAKALTESLFRRHRNVAVQDFQLGLDFGGPATGARLAVGSYVAVQIPESLSLAWTWEDWVYAPARGLIVRRSDGTTLMPHNYVILGIAQIAGQDGPAHRQVAGE